jgi:hemoglobin-like flavoprotein
MLVMKQLNRSIMDLRGQLYALEQLGKRHVPRKVGRKYFESIGLCLIRVIAMSLGEDEFDVEAVEIFKKAYYLIISAMLKHNDVINE